jgi:hypothetical protein
MTLYKPSDTEIFRTSSDEIKKQLSSIRIKTITPSYDNLKNAQNIILEYCRRYKKKIYGGYALHLLFSAHKEQLYDDTTVPDIDIYTENPVKDMFALCNLLHENGHLHIRGEEAMHDQTYSIKYYNETICDLTYMPKNIYDRTSFIPINDLRCVHPHFSIIDYLRIITDPIVNHWRLFNNDDCKTFSRLVKIQSLYPFTPIKDVSSTLYKKNDKNIQNALNIIYNFLLNRTTTVTIGFYAYNYLHLYSNAKTEQVPFYEFISIDYRKDALELINSIPNISYIEYLPFFQFTGFSVDLIMNNNLICRIYDYNKRYTPYQDVSAYDFNNNKASPNKNIRIGSYQLILMYMIINMHQKHVERDNHYEKFYNNIIVNCINIRNDYFTKNNKTFVDDTLFRDCVFNYIGEGETTDKARINKIEKRKRRNKIKNINKPLWFRYIPADNYSESLTRKFSFPNSSGNHITNPKLLKLATNENDIDFDDSDTDEQSVISK